VRAPYHVGFVTSVQLMRGEFAHRLEKSISGVALDLPFAGVVQLTIGSS